MSDSEAKIKSFMDLRAWQGSHQLVLSVYNATSSFPEDQRFGLSSQLQRAVISIPSNIAEGFGRQTYKDQIHFYYVALGSVNEVQCQLLIAKDLGFIASEEYQNLHKQTIGISKMLNGLIKSLKSRPTHT